MKTNYTQIFTLIVAMFFISFAKAQDLTTAQNYHDYILNEQAKIVNDNIHYISNSLHDHKARQNEAERKIIIQHLDEAIIRVNNIPTFKGDNSLKEAALEVFKHYKETFTLELKKADSLEIHLGTSYNSAKAYFELQNTAEEKLLKTGKKFIQAQKNFIRHHKLSKNQDEVLCLFSKTAEVNAYSRKIFLAYTKVSEVNQNFFDALKKKQTMSMEKNRQLVLATAEEALATLNQLSHFDGNKEYLEKGLKLTHHLKNAANQEYAELVSFLKKKDATQNDAIKFNKTIINYHKQAKNLLTDFTEASTKLLHKSVVLESNPILAKEAQKNEQKSMSHTIKSSLALLTDVSYETSVSMVIEKAPQE